MLNLAAEKISSHLSATAWFGAIAILTSFLAFRWGFFKYKDKKQHVTISTASMVELFLLFLVISLIGPFLLRHIVMAIAKGMSVPSSDIRFFLMTTLQIGSEILLLLLIGLYAFAHNRIDMRRIFKLSKSSVWKDLGIGAAAWIVSFPAVAAIDGLFESINLYFFKTIGPPQIAVEFIRALAKSSYLWLGLLITVIIAPFIEEFIFRGCIQTYLRNRMTRMKAIVGSSILFSIVHFAPSQGVGNIPLLVSIFAFGLYLGFIYERQGSLFASFALHATFNALSLVRILYVS